ncbi:MAG: 4-alpha-glucanotransferase, partial [Terriglobales bacterium]
MRIDTKNKLAGILVPAFALRHDRDLGIGDTIAMRNAIDFCAANKIGVLQILPINETGGDNSPYTAISSAALDPAYLAITPDAVPGLSAEMVADAVPDHVRQDLQSGSVQYHKVKQLKNRLLAAAFAQFEKNDISAGSPHAKALSKFSEENQRWLEPYTLYRTLIDLHGGDTRWTVWEPQFQTFTQAQEAVSQLPNASEMEEARKFWAYVQWVAYTQWRELKDYAGSKSVDLMGDLPFGVGRYSVDVWYERELFDLDWSCGAPPEKFFQGDRFTRQWG